MNNIVREDIKIIDVADWDHLVRTTYDRPYNFQQQDGCMSRGTFELKIPDEEPNDFKNDSIPEKINGSEMGVSFEAWLARDPKEWNGDLKDSRFIDMFWERNFYPDIYTLANDLYEKGLIDAGKYLINIDW